MKLTFSATSKGLVAHWLMANPTNSGVYITEFITMVIVKFLVVISLA